MIVPEAMEKQYLINRLVETGVLVPAGQGKIADLPLPVLPSKIPISFDDILGLETPSPPLSLKFLIGSTLKTIYQEQPERCVTKRVRAGVKANRTLNNLRNTKLLIFLIFTERNIAKTTHSR